MGKKNTEILRKIVHIWWLSTLITPLINNNKINIKKEGIKMKWTIEKNVILEALNNVTKALSQRTTIPVLNGIVFDVSEKGIELLASDSELTIKVLIKHEDIKMLEGKGRIIIQSKYFVDMIRKMPSEKIDFEVEDN